MRMLLRVKFPHDTFNAAVKDGTIGKKTQRILDELKPEAVYFTEMEGHRGAIVILDVAEPSKIPAIAEPFFLLFNADCSFHLVMSPAELGKSGLESIAKKWA